MDGNKSKGITNYFIAVYFYHSGPENQKRPGQRLVKSNKSISIFSNFRNDHKSIFELGKSLKQPEMQFNEKQTLIYLISRSFFCLDFLKFSGPRRAKHVVHFEI